MTNHRCINGNLDAANYASPIPFIGLYIAAASLVCLLMMLYDIVSGVRSRKRWLPCKAFTLNSVTLTLLSIATKIPVDLTTTMPSTMDQLSKLCGTTVVCISVGFLFPSFGVLSRSESFSNIVSLTIFVVTIIVNICIQLSTGVIILFVVEHIIILCCMCMLLLMSWLFYWLIDTLKMVPGLAPSVIEGGSVFIWLKDSYRFFSPNNPQLVACLEQTCVAVTIISSLSSIILIQAAVRSFSKQLHLCSGISDYNWSVLVIVVTQILLVVIGMLAICSRLIAVSKLLVWDDIIYVILKRDEAYRKIKENPILGIRSSLHRYSMPLKHFLLKTLVMVMSFIIFLPRRVLTFLNGKNTYTVQRWNKWVKQKAAADCERWRGTDKKWLPTPLSKLLSKTYPPRQFSLQLRDKSTSNIVGVNSLSIVLLVRIAQVSLPDNLSELLVHAFDEMKEILHYIDNHTRPIEWDSQVLLFAKAVWEGAEFSCLLSKILEKTTFGSSPYDLRGTIHIIKHLETVLPSDKVSREVSRITHIILQAQRYSSIEDLGIYIQHMFVEMLRMMLAQLPTVICKSISDSPSVEYEERVKVACQYLCKVAPVDHQIQWEWPVGSKFSSL